MKKIFLTGASAGIGLATAHALTAAGHEVWGTSRDAARLPKLAHFHGVTLDLCDAASIAPAFTGAWEEAGGFDVVINNAGSGHFGPAEFLPAEILRAQFELLVFGQIALCQLALREMQKRERGLIINITSLASRLPVPFTAGYNAAKAAMAIWTFTTQLELGDSAVRIVDVQPGDTSTDFNDSVQRDATQDSRYSGKVEQAWTMADGNMRRGTKPAVVAQQLVRLVEHRNPPPRLTIGGTFERIVAPMMYRLLPPRLRVWGMRRYYGI